MVSKNTGQLRKKKKHKYCFCDSIFTGSLGLCVQL